MKRQSGFTLIELLLVLAIIGIISAIAIPALLGQKERANQKTTEATAQSVVAELVSAAKLMPNPTRLAVRNYVAGLPNFIWPRCKNPYTPTVTALKNGVATAADGDVSMNDDQAAAADTTLVNVIVVAYQHKGTTPASTSTILSNVPVE